MTYSVDRKKDQNSVKGPGEVKKKRGAQPGNKNALRNGFYSSHFKSLELEDVAKASSNLDDEIAMLRVVSRRTFEFASENEPGSLQEWSKLLSALGGINTRIASLIRQRSMMEMDQNDEDKTISQAIAEVVRELGCGK